VTISRVLSGKRVRTRQALELAVAMFYRIINTFLGDAWQPQEVCFMHDAPEHPEFHRRFFGTRVRFDRDYDGIVCRAADLEKSIPGSDPAMARYLIVITSLARCCKRVVVRHLHHLVQLPSPNAHVPAIEQR